MADRWLVAGGGFRGIVGAYLLARANHPVVLVDSVKSSSDLGGVLSSTPWQGFYLDKGCHLFANTDDKITEVLMDLLGEENSHPVTVRYASIINRTVTDGFAIPDLSAYGEAASRDILYQLLKVASEPPAAQEESLQDKLNNRYGTVAGDYLSAAFRKQFRAEAADISPEAFSTAPFKRIRFLDDKEADILKESPVLDDRVASSSQSDPMRFWRKQAQRYPFREFYPNKNGTRGFCEQAALRLAELGVSMELGWGIDQVRADDSGINIVLSSGATVKGDRLLWTAGIEALGRAMGLGDGISDYIHSVPSLLYYFSIPSGTEGPYTYLQNFDLEDLFFRASVPGSYGLNNCPEGLSYVCCEISTSFGSPEWCNPGDFAPRVWTELRQYDVVRCEEPVDLLAVKVPSSYKLPKVGYRHAAAQLLDRVVHRERVLITEQWEFSKNDSIRSLQNMLEGVESGRAVETA